MISFDDRTTAADVRAAAQALSEDEARALLYDWELWARPEQLMPAGDWRTWLILGGRGSGKTRPGAEAVRKYADEHPGAIIALVGPTSADCRDVMVEGESGLLNVYPPDERPVFKPSRRLVWFRNGARGYTYSAEEPERLRGPQHHFAWCLTGDTGVLMADGSERALRDLAIDDYVQTRKGPRRVTGHALTRRNAEVFQLSTVGGRGIIGTSDHPVWVLGRGFIPLTDIRPGMFVCVNNALNGMAIPGIATAMVTTPEKSDYIARCGNPFTGASCRDSRSTTSTATRPITGSRTWSCFRTARTAVFIWKKRSGRIARGLCVTRWLQWRRQERQTSGASFAASSAAQSITAAPSIRPLTALRNVSKLLAADAFEASSAVALDAARGIGRPNAHNFTAQRSATRERLPIEPQAERNVPSFARSAASNSSAPAAMLDFATGPAPSLTTDAIACVKRLARRVDVYDIAVAQDGEFFANGILVHNCDEIAAYPDLKELWDIMIPGMRLGSDPRRIATTTPKPLPFLKSLLADPHTRVSRMRTEDNRANLPPALLEELERVYGGTRIGRQELEGELLEEAEGALWRRAQIDALRVRQADVPELVRIVIPLDPSVTSGPNSDECGIVPVGLGVDGHGYVLRDLSGVFSPDDWASRSVAVFDDLDADKIIGEANNGGDLIETVIRTKRKTIPYEKVHASRGKITRAEPIAALYEQGRVHHVGGFPQLEDEMCNYVPGASKSPNRMDALVWGLTFLMLKPVRVGRVLGV